MADITMCLGKDCKVKDKCYRFTANKNEFMQSYFLNPPFEIKDNTFTCEMFWGKESESIYKSIKDILK